MASNEQALEDRLKKLESKVAELEERCEFLQWRADWMMISKVDNPERPYRAWQLMYIKSTQERHDLENVLAALNDRVTGKVNPNERHLPIEGVPDELLYSAEPLKIEDVFQAIRLVTKFKHNLRIVELLQAMERQGIYVPLCEFFTSWYMAVIQTG